MALLKAFWLNPVKKLMLLLAASTPARAINTLVFVAFNPACRAMILALAASTPAKAIAMFAFCAMLTA